MPRRKVKGKMKPKMKPKYVVSKVFEYIDELVEEGKTKWVILNELMENYKIDGDEAMGLYMGYLAQTEDSYD